MAWFPWSTLSIIATSLLRTGWAVVRLTSECKRTDRKQLLHSLTQSRRWETMPQAPMSQFQQDQDWKDGLLIASLMVWLGLRPTHKCPKTQHQVRVQNTPTCQSSRGPIIDCLVTWCFDLFQQPSSIHKTGRILPCEGGGGLLAFLYSWKQICKNLGKFRAPTIIIGNLLF